MEAGLFLPTGTMANQIGLRLHCTGNGHLVAAEPPPAHVASTEVMTSAPSSRASRTGRFGRRAAGSLPSSSAGCSSRRVLRRRGSGPARRREHGRRGRHGPPGGRAAPDPQAHRRGQGADPPRRRPDLQRGGRGGRRRHRVDPRGRHGDVLRLEGARGAGRLGPVRTARGDAGGAALKILYGGAWRQAGVLAAAGLVALEEGPRQLHEDHARARRLAEALAEIAPGSVDLEAVETNMVFVDTSVMGSTRTRPPGAWRARARLHDLAAERPDGDPRGRRRRRHRDGDRGVAHRARRRARGSP